MEANTEKIIDGNKIDGRAIAAHLFDGITKQVAQLKFKPILCDVVVGSDPVSLTYVKIKGKKAVQCGMEFSLVQLPDTATTEQVIEGINSEQQKKELCGLIVQLPLPAHLDSNAILSAINSKVDVDAINPSVHSSLLPPTAGAIMQILDSLQINLEQEKFLVLGQGDLVGKPVTALLKERGFSVTTATAETEDRSQLLKQATVIITGVGKAGILTGEQVGENVIVIDAGTSESGGSISGDVDFESVAPKAKFITPSPGGVGPVTVAKLLENVLAVGITLDTAAGNE